MCEAYGHIYAWSVVERTHHHIVMCDGKVGDKREGGANYEINKPNQTKSGNLLSFTCWCSPLGKKSCHNFLIMVDICLHYLLWVTYRSLITFQPHGTLCMDEGFPSVGLQEKRSFFAYSSCQKTKECDVLQPMLTNLHSTSVFGICCFSILVLLLYFDNVSQEMYMSPEQSRWSWTNWAQL